MFQTHDRSSALVDDLNIGHATFACQTRLRHQSTRSKREYSLAIRLHITPAPAHERIVIMMRWIYSLALLTVLCLTPAAAFAQGTNAIVGFGGLSLNSIQSASPSLGGTVTFDLVPNMQVVAEVGRMGNVLPAFSNNIFSATGAGLRASAWYGEGGVRVLASGGAVAPYAEATAGIARMDVRSARLSGIGNAATAIALGFAGRTTPVAGGGGGVVVRGGPIVFDVGYRYKQLFANNVLQSVLGLGQPLRTHQVRASVGVRF